MDATFPPAGGGKRFVRRRTGHGWAETQGGSMLSDIDSGGGGGGDEQDRAEALDESEIVLDEFGQDLNDGAMDDYPPDRLQGANEYGITPQEERIDEPLAERAWREEPDPAAELVPHDAEGAGDLDELEDLGLLDPVPGEPEEVPVDPMVLEAMGDEEHPVPPGEELEAEVSTVTEAYESEDPPEAELLGDERPV